MEKLTALDGAKIADAVYRFEPQVGEYTIAKDKNTKQQITYNDPNIGLQLALYENSATGDYVIAVRGTEPTTYGDWDTNIRMFVSTLADMLPSAFIQALQFIEPLMETYGLNSSNTSIVGHSMGGSIAQYLGSVKGFETLTYNAYGVGDMNMVPDGSHENITNYITMHDFVSPLPGSQMVGTTYMLQDEDLTDVFGHGITNFTSVESWVRGYSPVDDPRSIDVIDGIGSSGLDSIYELALMLSEGREFAMINGSMNDVIFGGDINNTLISGGGNDTLIGGKGFDTLQGGADYDTYIVGNGDILEDDDANKGKVIFKDIDLTGKKYKNSESGRYEDDDFVYEESGETLTVTAKSGGESITIKNWDMQKREALGIELLDNKDIEVSITESASASEGDSGKRSLSFTVTLSRALEDGESLDVSVSDTDEGSYTFQSGEQSKTFTHSWNGDTRDEGAIDHIATFTPTASYDGPYEDAKVTIKNSLTLTVNDDDEDKRHDPLALDMNKDGFISTSDLETSGTYFDITGDGLRERVGWIKSEDALVTYDKNDNGQIDGISEVFGNMNESGFEELKRLIDSNHDNIIDRKDELFNHLQVWNDFNQDAKVQEGELRSLKDAGVTSIDLNYVSTNIEINGNLLTEASKYTDAQGNKELAADIQLATDAKDTKLELQDLPEEFTIDPATQLLPQLKGTGLVYDSLITYNLDPEFKALAQEMSTNMPRVATEFSTFLEHYSGYTAYVNELQEKYSIENFQMQEVDKQAWIVERFEATDKYTTTINDYYNKSLNNSKIPTTPITKSDTVATKYQALTDTLQSTFAMQSVYQDIFSDTHYDLDTQSFIVDDKNALESKLAEYFNSDTNTIDEKLYLAKVMHLQQGGLEFEIDTILKSINNDITKELARYIFTGENATLFETKESYTAKGIIVTSSEDEIITTSDANNKILLNGGDDKLQSGKGNDTFYFRKGDGADTIFDKGGVDVLVFDEGITRESVELKLNRNSDLIIALKEDGKTFDEYSDKVILVDWMKSSNRVELIKFSDGTTLKFQDVFELFEATDGVEVIQLSSGNDIIDTKDGNDVIVALGGNDTLIGGKGDDRLDGGLGNDTYIYARGDGKDTVIESGGHDTLQFREGISQDDLVVQYKGNDLLIALKEEGKTFEQLSDVITLKNYKNVANTIEAIYLDGYRRVDIDALLNAPTEFDDILELSNNDQNIDLLAGDDSVVTLGGNDIVYGGSGNDIIKTNSGNDTLAGGTGDDVLEGGLGNDTYIYNRGDGKDTIYDDYSYGYQNTQKDNAGNDTLRLGEGITADDIVTKYYGTDLMIGIKEGDKPFEELSDVITIKNYGDEKNKIEHIVLSDGSEIEVTGPVSINGYETVATTGDDVLFFEEGISIDTLQGHDFIHTGSGNDNVFGNRGNDDIHTGDGDDILNGGVGIDYLLGGDGNDTYVFNRGDGNNTIFDDNRDGYVADTNMYHGMYTTYPKITQSSTPQKDAGVDTLIFGEGITLDDIEVRISTESFSSSPRDIVIYIKENGNPIASREQNGNIAGDTVTIRDYFDSRNKIENILLSDGTRIDIDSMINQVTNGDDQIIYLSSNEDMTIDAQDGNDIVKIGLGNDTIIGGKGNDQLQGGGGDDTYIFNRGDGKDTIYDYDEARGGYFSNSSIRNGGNDTLKFGAGITQEDLEFVFQSNDLEIKIIGTEDSIMIRNYNNTNNAIENIAFDDGITVNMTEMALKSLGENVVVPVQEGQENVYTLNYDEGVKTILNSKTNDTLQIAESIGVEQLIAQFVESDLVIALKESGVSFDGLKDKVVIKNYLYDKIENIIFNDGSKIKLNDILLQASEDDDTLRSYEQEAIAIDGLAGNDTIITGSGNDILIGGRGNDTLNGGAGDDTYIFNRGDGQDVISYSNGNDTLKFANGIEAQDLEARYVGQDLVIGVKESGVAFEDWSDNVTIKSNFLNNITLNDGTKLVVDDLLFRPTQGDDVLDYTHTQNPVIVDGLGGNDTITTSSGNDTLIGGSGNDTLKSGAGNDILNGGEGDDTLLGGVGNDTYIFNRGNGRDMVHDIALYNQDAGNDTILFGEGIVQSDLLFKQDDYNLTIALKEDGKTYDELSDQIVITDWFKLKNNIETLKFADGSSMSASEIATMLLSAEPDTLYSKHGAEIFGGMGDDTYVYKKDDFTVIIDDKFTNKEIAVNAGNDTLRFEDITQDQVTIGTKGDDLIIKIDAGHDTYTELKDYVVIRDWQDANKGIESIVFADDEVLAIDKTATYPELEFDEHWITGRYYIYGSEDNDIEGTEHSEVIESGAGNDTVMALGGNDYIVGGKGDDILNGGSGNDTYVFNIGDGNDTIIDASGLDSIKFGSNITRADIFITQVDNDLVMRLSADDSLTLKDWFNEETIEHRIELMVLEDEGEIAIADFIITPTEENDNLEYGDEKNRINALGGDDIIHIGGGDDVLFGGDGNDRLYGEEGNDTLSGDKGDDILYGAEGDDTYVYARGDGKDTIVEDDFINWGQTGNDTLKFAEGISAADLILRQVGDDLVVALKEDDKSFEELSDKITLKKWSTYDDANSRDYSRAYYAVESFIFSDGTSWSTSDIIANIGSDADETIIGFNQADTLEGKKGDDILLGHLGDDTYVFSRGDGHDTIYDYGRKGDDYSYYDAGNDTLKFGDGITEEELIIVKDEDDVIVYIKDGDKPITELSDMITIKNWFVSNNRIENMILSDGTEIDYIKYLTIEPTEESDRLVYGNGDDYVDALAGDDIVISLGGNNFIDGNSGNDSIQTANGNDTLLGGEGDDTLDGGAGEDRLEGGSGNDIYIFGRGDGHNTIYDESGVDSLKFDASITQDDLVLFQDGRDLVVAIKEDGVDIANTKDKIILVNWLDVETRLETITFTDGTVWDVATIVSNTGTEKDDIISGTELDDALYGGKGNDTYIFGRGDGHDTIYDVSGTDSLRFGEDITTDDLLVRQDGDDLVIALKEEGVSFDELADRVSIKNWLSTENRVETIVLADGEVLDASNMIELMPSDGDDAIVVPDELAVNIHLKDGDDTIEAGSQNDTLYGGKGNDYLEGGAGDDTYVFERGDGHDTIYDVSGTDSLRFGEDITTDDLLVRQDGDDLVIALKEEGVSFDELADRVSIKNWLSTENRVETIVLADGEVLDASNMIELMPSDGDDAIVVPDELAVNIHLKDGDDTIEAGSQNDTLYGDGGNDELYAGEGNDTLLGGTGDDYLEGGEGNDTYIFNRGDGHDEIYDVSGTDSLRFGEDIATDDLLVRQDGDDLVIALKEEGVSFDELADRVSIKNWLSTENRVETIVLADGEVLDASNMIELMPSDGDDAIVVPDELAVNIHLKDGDDTIEAGSQNDTLYGDGGNDELYAGEGNDTLLGGTGDDYLEGGAGDDTYVFERGDGHDTIYDVSGTDSLRFGEDITTDDLLVRQDGDDLIIALKEEGVSFDELADMVTIKEYFSLENKIENFDFADGSSVIGDDILLFLENEEGIVVYGTSGSDTLIGGAGDDILNGADYYGGDDTFIGNEGNDMFYGGWGNDTYVFNRGDGHDTISDEGSYSYYGDTGQDKIVFGEGISKDDLIVHIDDAGNLTIGLLEEGVPFEDLENTITILNYASSQHKIEAFVFADGSSIMGEEIFEHINNNIIYGTSGDDTLYGSAGDEIFYAGDGNDTIYGYGGNDTYIGGKGRDYMNNWDGGDDTYIFNRGDGQDIIYDYLGNDTLRFGAGIRAEDLIIRKSEDDVIIGLKESEKSFKFLDKITLSNWHDSSSYRIENIVLNDGTRIDMSSMLLPTKMADRLYADDIGTTIDGLAGNDTIYGNTEDNIIIGGKGADSLFGGGGDDVYLFNRGDGHDNIYDSDGADSLQFGIGISTNDLIFRSDNDDFIIGIKEDGKSFEELSDVVRLHDWFSNNNSNNIARATVYASVGYSKVENILFSDGSSFDTSIFDTKKPDTLYPEDNSNYIYGGYEDNVFAFNRGDGHTNIYDYNGNDTLRFGEGISVDDLVIQSEGTSILIGIKEDGKSFSELSDRVVLSGWFNSDQKIETTLFHDGTVFDTSVFNEFTPDYLRLDNTDNIAYGQGGDDTIYGNGGNDILYGGDGNDYIDGGLGNDIYIGGKGNDHIYEWSQGDDTYIYNRGDGQDSIWDHNGNDTLSFGEGINIDDMVVQLETANGGLTIVVGIKEEGKTFAELSNKIQLNGWLNHESGNKLISFSNGETYTIKELYQHLYGTQVIFGSDVDETITGGAGDDILIGGLGNDTYVFNRGDGNDTIVDISQWGDMNEDILSFGEGITVDDLDVFYYEESLKINILATDGSTNDSITILNWYSQSAIEFIRLSDGSEYSIADYFGVPMNEYPAPIVLDLNHNGITSTTLETSNAYFDYDGDGNREHTGWTDKGDALLVADLNNDGIINDGSEQFGERTRLANGLLAGSGYEALVQYDTNGDRIIDNRDEAFGNLLLWKDANQNGKTEEGELINIQTSGILALHLDQASGITFEQSTENGNIILNETNYVTLGGGGIMRDVGFAYDPFNTITDNDTLIVEQYGSTLSGAQGDDTYLFNLGEGKVTIDDMGDGMDIIRFGVNISKEQLMVKWDKASGDLIIGVKENGTDISSLADLYDQIHIKNFFDESGSIEEFRFADGSSIDKNELYDILLDTKEIQNLTAIALEKDGQLIGGAFNDLLYGQDSEEELHGGAGDDFLNGQHGDDLLDGGEGDDTLIGGEGDDSLYGGAGDDYYIYNKGDGKDLITESFGNDSLILGEGILKDDLIIQRDGNDLLVGLKDGDKTLFELSDLIRIKNQFIRSFEVETIELASGEIIHLPTSYELVAEDITVSLLEDTSTTGTLNVINSIGGALTYEIVEMSNNGEFTLDQEGSYSYIPSANYNGSDSVSIKVTNEYGLSTTNTLSFEIEAVNDAPILLNNATESYTLKNIREVDGSIEAEDIDGDTLNYTVTTATTHGTFNIDANGNWNYQANASFNGKDSATITIDDGNGGSVEKTLHFQRDGYIYEGGNLLINDTSDNDTLVMNTINKSDLSFTRQANNLKVHVQDEGVVTLQNYFANTKAGVDTIQTAQGSINLSKDAIKTQGNSWFNRILIASDARDTLLTTNKKNSFLMGQGGDDTIFGGSGNDYILAQDGNDLLIAGAGNDTLYGGNGNDTLYGDNGNDTLFGGHGHDSLIGGLGNDTLYGDEGDDFLSGGKGKDILKGGLGDDTYFFSKGDGKDTIADSEPSRSFLWFNFNTQDGGDDTVKFDKDITKEDISFYMRNNDLILQYSDNDSITIKNQNNKNAQIEKLELSDGSYLTNEDIERITQQISAYGKDKGMWHIDNKTIQANNDLMNIVSSAWQA